MCHWLRARLFVTDFRPVPLQEYAVFGGQVHAKVSPAFGNNFLSSCVTCKLHASGIIPISSWVDCNVGDVASSSTVRALMHQAMCVA